jgi:hypothetical protein
MARVELKALSRKRLKYQDVPQYFELISSEHPRMAAILAAAGVEDGLEFAIEHQFMRGMSETEFRTIFDSDDMLATFGAKIKMGHALRLYGDITQADLNCIKDIRNVFAHAKINLDFSNELVVDACKQLQGPYGPSTEDKKNWSAQRRFMQCAEYLYLEFLSCATQPVPERIKPGLP